MVRWKNRPSDLAALKIAVVMVVLGIFSATVLLVNQQYQVKPAYAATNPNTTTTAWPVQSNATYGLSYSYPSSWAPSGDVINDPKTSATRQEFGTGLKLNGINTVKIEVLDEPLQTAAAWYDQYYAQTPIKVNKTTATLKGKQSIEYDFVAPTYETKQYLFAVGTKTYLFSCHLSDIMAVFCQKTCQRLA